MDLTDIYRTFPLNTADYETISKLDHIQGHKISLNTYKKIKLTPYILSVHPGLKMGINNRNNRKVNKIIKTKQLQWNDKGIKKEKKTHYN